MVAGHLRVINGIFHIILSFKGEGDKKRSPSFTTNLPRKNNQRLAEEILAMVRTEYKKEEYDDKKKRIEEKTRIDKLIEDAIIKNKGDKNKFSESKMSKNEIAVSNQKVSNKKNRIRLNGDMLFSDYMLYWLHSVIKMSIALNTYATYCYNIEKRIAPYFRELEITLINLEPLDIQEYYCYCMEEEGIKSNTIIRRHANIRKALQFAVDMGVIKFNPADKVKRPKADKYIASVYNENELNQLFKIVENERIEFAVLLASYYALRREEVVGLKWSAIDFDKKTITIKHTVTTFTIDGNYIEFEKDCGKNDPSNRTLPLVKPFEKLLKIMKNKQITYRRLCGDSYCTKYSDYIYVDETGKRIKPGYITSNFSNTLKKNNMRHIRFHDLRHSCATLLLKSGVSLKHIQEWLGHSDITITANTYSHLDFDSKMVSANAIYGLIPDKYAGQEVTAVK